MAPMSWNTKSIVLLGTALIGPVSALVLLGFADTRALWIVLGLVPVGVFLTRRMISPVTHLSGAAERLRRGELEARPDARLEGPWQQLAHTLTDLAQQLDTVSKDLEQQVQQRTAELDRKASQLRALGQIGQQVASVLEPSELLHFVVRLVRGTFGYDLVTTIQEREAYLIVSACAAKGVAEPPVGRVFRSDDPAVATVAAPIANHTVSSAVTPIVPDIAARTELVVPIRLAERTLGVLVVQSLSLDAFDDDDVFTVKTIAGQVAVALENARLFEAERRLRSLAITEERTRMSREIHDTLAQGFMGILMHLRAMRGVDDTDSADRHRQAAESLAQQNLDEARRSIWNLRPARLHDKGLTAALQDELHRLERQASVATTLHLAADRDKVDDLPPDHAAALLRIGQEALHNVAKHAQAGCVVVTLHTTNEAAELRIQDDGVGFAADSSDASIATARGDLEPTAPTTFGLVGMRERAQWLGGTVKVKSGPGTGTEVCVRLPLGKEAAT